VAIVITTIIVTVTSTSSTATTVAPLVLGNSNRRGRYMRRYPGKCGVTSDLR
jgi:hypothetical protein